ncbi:MAG: helix-turn-helix domain-containing protein [Propionibacteriaceae bacterium]|jgi:transcriptional regulator with XRE-family HTH domain|nr:helix-turn-helix domain-containing protein [Propionibacteriaceae bacterium]
MQKRDVFGTFVAQKRRAAGLSQRGLADQLHVTESAVSKWERGVSYPDITMIAPLSQALGVSDHELMSASDDREYAQVSSQASSFRTQRAIVTWGSAIAYGIALVTCFIVNIAVGHGLTWFFIVLTAIMVAASLTVLPYWVGKRRWLIVLGAFLASLFLLFLAIWLQTGRGWWLIVAILGTLFGCVVVFGPLVLRGLEPAGWLGRNKTLVCLAVDTVLLFALVLVAMAASGALGQYGLIAVPIIIVSILPVWLIAMTIRYLPISGWYRAAISLVIITIWEFFGNAAINRIVDGTSVSPWGPFDLFDWSTSALINSNITLIASASCLIIAAVLAVIGTLRRSIVGSAPR